MQIFKDKWKESIKNSAQSLKPTWKKEKERNVKRNTEEKYFQI